MRALTPIALALALPAAAEDAPLGVAASYLCDGGAVLQVAYLNPESGPSLAVVAYGGQLVPMRAGPTGSGVRYLAIDPALGLIWHSKGREGTLYREGGPAGRTALLGGCREAGS